MLHLPMILWILAHCNGRLVVHPKHRAPRNLMLKHVLGRALKSQRTKGDCREAMKTKVKICFSATLSNLTMLQTNTNMAQMVRSIVLAQQLKCSSAAPINHNNILYLSSPRNWPNQMNSFPASTAEMYSASMVDRATSV
jgi:hypothetical protein